MRLWAAGVFCLALAACGGSGNTQYVKVPVAAAVTLRYVKPIVVNPAVDPIYDYENVYAPPAGTHVNKLFLFLPGTWAPPRAYTDIISAAALHGYHTISLDYPNLTEIDSAGVCGNSTDPNCWGNYRSEVITGNDTSPYVSVSKVNSITQRLVDMIAYAAKTYPAEGWDQYVSGGAPVWQNIYVGGHSQGAGDAAYLGYLYSMGRTCSIEGPDDGNATIPVAAWQQQPQATPASRKYGFFNEADQFVPWSRASNIWNVLAFPGSPTDVDAVASPYNGSHQLYTNRPSYTVLNSHDLTVMDMATPINADGTFVFAPVWQYACFP